MARWINENAFDGSVQTAHKAFPTVPPELIKAVIATESGFNPKAVRGEPQLGDASRGLMQLLMSTARSQGYGGTDESLFLPAINLYYGTKLLADLYSKVGNWPDAISAYNGGIRPTLGFGGRAPADVRICLQWKATAPAIGRSLDRDCAKIQHVKAGEYANKDYVTKVLANWAYFQQLQRPLGGSDTAAPFVPPVLSRARMIALPVTTGQASIILPLLGLLGTLVLVRRRQRR